MFMYSKYKRESEKQFWRERHSSVREKEKQVMKKEIKTSIGEE